MEQQRHIQQLSVSSSTKVQEQKVLIPEVPAPADIMDDFYIIAQETNSNRDNTLDNISSETQVKSLTKFLRNITGGTTSSSPINSTAIINAASSAPNSASSNSNQTVNYVEQCLYSRDVTKQA